MSSDSDSFIVSSDNDSDFAETVSKKVRKQPTPKAKKPAKPKGATVARVKKPSAKKDSIAGTPEKGGAEADPEHVFETIEHATQGGKKRLSVEQIYKRVSQIEHVLIRPETYIGSAEHHTEHMWVYNKDKDEIEFREITYVPGLYKIFDEILVNAADNKVRDKKQNLIKIDIDQEKGEISIFNNGKGIPVVEHKTENMYVPELIFGTLLTSSHYDDSQRKVTGGRNGFGAKLCNIFSKKFTVETSCRESKKSFKQVWVDNMNKDLSLEEKSSKKLMPIISEAKSQDFTRVTFRPDFKRFKLESLTDDMLALMSRRAYDIAGTTDVSVVLNGQKLPVNNFQKYVSTFLKGKTDDMGNVYKFEYERPDARWEVAVTHSDEGFKQVSFVNSIATTKGGKHVDHVLDKLLPKLRDFVKKKVEGGKQNKSSVTVQPQHVKNHIWIFVRCLIENPTFDSQTKDTLTLQAKNFGSVCKLSDTFIDKVKKLKIIDNVVFWAKSKEKQHMDSACDKRKRARMDIEKLVDANNAGKKGSEQCALLLCEGDSAKTLAISGFEVVGRDNYGVFPLRGKPLNVRECSTKQILDNKEITNVIKALGLQYKKKYDTAEDLKSLRYGRVIIMTDQDHDGSHIKGLLINFFQYNWPSLIRRNYIEEFITPIVKVSKGNNVIPFFSLPEYEEWKNDTPDWHTYTVKYYKGLGTSTRKEAMEYFSDLRRHRIKFRYDGEEDDKAIELAFSKSKIQERKDWLTQWMEERKRRTESGLPEIYLYEKNTREIGYKDFVNKELVLFSNLDNERSIPSLVDGLKPGQRKVLFVCFKRKLKREIKVAQLVGSVGEQSAYHHGEASLMSTIVNLAQNYVGSNNINLLLPIGQFGTRLQGGKDAASARYIFTKLTPITRAIFPEVDDKILKYLYDDNQRIEPEWYCPILPTVLVNGVEGIGTGWSTKVPNYNPIDVVKNLLLMMDDKEPEPMHPWYRGFNGDVHHLGVGKYAVSGECGILNDESVEIIELPVKVWTETYRKAVLQPLLDGDKEKNAKPFLTDLMDYNTDVTVRFVLKMSRDNFAKAHREGFHKMFKLQSSLTTSSMVLFDANNCLKRYDSVLDILKEFYAVRLRKYEERKRYRTAELSAECSKLSEQARFILMKIEGKIICENKKKKEIVDQLIKLDFKKDPVEVFKREFEIESEEEPAAEAEHEDEAAAEAAKKLGDAAAENKVLKGYEYLVNQFIIKLSLEEKQKLEMEVGKKEQELATLKRKTPKDLWKEDLKHFEDEYKKFLAEEKASEEGGKKTGSGGSKGRGGIIGGGIKKGTKKHLDTLPSAFSERVIPVYEELEAKHKEDVERKERMKAGIVRKRKVDSEPNNGEEAPLWERVMHKRRESMGTTEPLPDEKEVKKLMVGKKRVSIEKKKPKLESEAPEDSLSINGADEPEAESEEEAMEPVNRPKRERKVIKYDMDALKDEEEITEENGEAASLPYTAEESDSDFVPGEDNGVEKGESPTSSPDLFAPMPPKRSSPIKKQSQRTGSSDDEDFGAESEEMSDGSDYAEPSPKRSRKPVAKKPTKKGTALPKKSRKPAKKTEKGSDGGSSGSEKSEDVVDLIDEADLQTPGASGPALKASASDSEASYKDEEEDNIQPSNRGARERKRVNYVESDSE